jgi:hypothetical protein
MLALAGKRLLMRLSFTYRRRKAQKAKRVAANKRTFCSHARLPEDKDSHRRHTSMQVAARRCQPRPRALFTSHANDRDKALKFWLQNLLDSPLIAFKWGFSRCWSVRVD